MKNKTTLILPLFLLIFGCSCGTNKNVSDDTVLKKLGLYGDGITDDAKQLNYLLAQLKVGETLHLPEGNFRISTPLLISTNGVSIIGIKDKTRLVFDNSKDWYKHYNKRVGIINIGANDVNIKYLELNQNFSNSGRKDGDDALIGGIIIGCKYLGKARKTKNILIENCKVIDYYGDAISVVNARSDNLTIRNNHLISSYIVGKWKTAGEKGEQAIGVGSGDNALIEGNFIYGALDDAIAFHTFSNNIVIQNNRITTTGGRILICGITKGLVKNNEITYIEDGGTGILISFESTGRKLSKSQNIIVEENTIKIEKGVKVRSGIYVYGSGSNITIQSNTIETENKNIGTGILIKDRLFNKTSEYHLGDNIRIKNNKIQNFKNGVFLEIEDSKFSNNRIIVDNNQFENLEVGSNISEGEETNNKYTEVKTNNSFNLKNNSRISRVNKGLASSEFILSNFNSRNKNKNIFTDFFISKVAKKINRVQVEGIQEGDFLLLIAKFKSRKEIARIPSTQLNSSLKTLILVEPGEEYRVTVTLPPRKDKNIKVKLFFD